MSMIGGGQFDEQLKIVSANWKWMVGLGVLMLILGVVGLGMAGFLTIVTVIWFGVLAICAGIAQMIDGFRYPGWKPTVGHVLVGALYLAAGVLMVVLPVQSAWWLTLLLAATFVAVGVFRIVMAVQMKQGGASVWLGLAGVISIALGLMVFYLVELPTDEAMATAESAATWFSQWGWVIGLFVAIDFIFNGVGLIGIGLGAKKIAEEGTAGPDDQSASPA
ncbi:MAG: DUF308 domain-containing protein [Pseudomonadota bacterium]